MFNIIVFMLSQFVQFVNRTEAILNFFLLQWDQNFIFRFLCLYRSDFDRITILETFIIKKLRYFWTYMSAILDFYDVYKFETTDCFILLRLVFQYLVCKYQHYVTDKKQQKAL